MGKTIRRDRNGRPYFKAPPPPDRALLEHDDGLNRKMKLQENKHIPTGNLICSNLTLWTISYDLYCSMWTIGYERWRI